MTTARDILESLHTRDSLNAESFPNEQNIGPVILLEQDRLLTRLAAVWTNVPTSKLDLDAVCPPETPESHRVRWLWALLEPDPFPGWVKTAGLFVAPHVIAKCWVLVDNQMVFPDGTISRWARNFIQRQASRAL